MDYSCSIVPLSMHITIASSSEYEGVVGIFPCTVENSIMNGTIVNKSHNEWLLAATELVPI